MVVGTFIATSASAQPYFHAHIGFRLPQPRVFIAPPRPVVVYNQPVYDQNIYDQPVCDQPVAYPNQVYDNTVVYENRGPVYYHENGYGRPRYVEVNRYHDRYDNRGYHENHYRDDHRDGGYRRW